MAYEKKTWKNRQSEFPNRRTMTPVDGQENTYDVTRNEGLVMEDGDAFDQTSMNDLENRVEYISFSKHATKEFIRLAPKGTPVYYLSGDATPQELKSWGCAGPDYHFSVFQKNPEWIEQCHKLGMKVNAWTVNDAKNMQWLIEHKVDFITTNEPVLLQQELKM